jgi:hypothetical protein
LSSDYDLVDLTASKVRHPATSFNLDFFILTLTQPSIYTTSRM